MKKSIALLALAFGVTGAYAQDLTSKKGEPILPEAEDWAIGVDATPFLNYAGNFFGKSSNNTYLANGWNNYGLNNTIVAKKFTDAQNAYRLIFRLGYSTQSWKNSVVAPPASSAAAVNYPNKPGMVEDKFTHSETNIALGVGMEKRKGKTRLQGFYGADVFIWFNSSKNKFKYGNALSVATADPNIDPNSGATTDWSAIVTNTAIINGSNKGSGTIDGVSTDGWRKLSEKPGGQFGLGVRAFIGAEYFILPKISLGGEFGFGIGLAMNTKSKTVYEAEGTDGGGTTDVKAEITATQKNGMQFILDTDRNPANSSSYNLAPSGTLRLNFHF
jgi:hypothetical protein